MSQQPHKHTKIPGESSSSSDTSSVCDVDTCVGILGWCSPMSKEAEPTLECLFPAIASSIKLFHGFLTKGDENSLRTMTPILAGNVASVYRQLKGGPKELVDDMRYLISKCQVRRCLTDFRTLSFPKNPTAGERDDYFRSTQANVNRLVFFLKQFIAIVNTLLIELGLAPSTPKPSPPSSRSSLALPSNDNHASDERLVGATAPKPRFTPTPVMKPTLLVPLLPASYSTETLATYKTTSSAKSFLRAMIRRLGKSKSSLSASSSTSILDLKTSFDAQTIIELVEDKKLPDMPYDPRRSAIYFPIGTKFSNMDIEKLMPNMEDQTIRLTSDGKLKAASLTSLVRILTSPEAARIPDFTHIFFMTFRFFTTPSDLFVALMERFNVLSSWMTPKLNETEKELVSLQAEEVRVSVVRALATWLWDYWRPETDSAILSKIEEFATRDLVGNVPDLKIAWGLAQAAWRIDSGMARYGNKIKLSAVPPEEICPLKATGYDIYKLCSQGPPTLGEVFCDEGAREEFARQVTIKASGFFFSVSPNDMIMLWKGRTKGLDKTRRALENLNTLESALCIWTLESILAESDPIHRANVLEFWIDITTRCIKLRNFSSAYSIYSGLSNSAISRLKMTVAIVTPRFKAQYRVFDALFQGRNWINYRKVLEGPPQATVPLLFVMKHDVSATEGMATKSPSEQNGEKTLINYNPVRVMMDTVTTIDNCRVQYYLSEDENYQDWMKGQLRRYELTAAEESQRLNALYQTSKKHESNFPQALAKADLWTNAIQTFWPDYPGPFRKEMPPG
ncbi:hypothetical protein ONZ45_g12968 [Pleurotus djamor]|nr:hypothetical protein ONZ45_g12968 [Pleurotus djamor]